MDQGQRSQLEVKTGLLSPQRLVELGLVTPTQPELIWEGYLVAYCSESKSIMSQSLAGAITITEARNRIYDFLTHNMYSLADISDRNFNPLLCIEYLHKCAESIIRENNIPVRIWGDETEGAREWKFRVWDFSLLLSFLDGMLNQNNLQKYEKYKSLYPYFANSRLAPPGSWSLIRLNAEYQELLHTAYPRLREGKYTQSS